jgi:hypothetical protein
MIVCSTRINLHPLPDIVQMKIVIDEYQSKQAFLGAGKAD